MKPTIKEIKEKLQGYFSTLSCKNGVFTLRKEYFYKHGKDETFYKNKVLEFFPNASIIDCGEVCKPFRGGASTANSSHWFVKFSFLE